MECFWERIGGRYRRPLLANIITRPISWRISAFSTYLTGCLLVSIVFIVSDTVTKPLSSITTIHQETQEPSPQAIEAGWRRSSLEALVDWKPTPVRITPENSESQSPDVKLTDSKVRGSSEAPVDYITATWPEPNPDALQFFSIGDQGNGGQAQRQVASMLQRAANYYDAKFVLGLGDNFYMAGVRNVKDPLLRHRFEALYTKDPLGQIPFHPTHGDHDAVGNVTALVAYSTISKSWNMPDHYYELDFPIPEGGGGGNFHVIVTDSVRLEGYFSESPDDRRFGDALQHHPEDNDYNAGLKHAEWLTNTLEESVKNDDTWRVVVGHRPVISGSARFLNDLRSFPVEAKMRAWLRDKLAASEVDLFLDGHDHTIQWQCAEGVNYVVNGIGGYDTHALRRDPPEEAVYQHTGKHGFAIHQVTKDVIQTTWIDMRGEVIKTIDIPHFNQCKSAREMGAKPMEPPPPSPSN